MSEVEKQIEIINKIRDSIIDNENIYLLCDSLEDITKNNKQSYDIQIIVSSLLNYIDKLQKENEEFQKANKMLNDFIISIQLDYVSKDKIRDKIKELEVKYKKHEKEGLYGFADRFDIGTRIDVLEELLGE